jgi:iron complex transport system permease protein
MRSALGRRATFLLLLALLASIILAAGLGTVQIPPGEVLRILMGRLPFGHLPPDWSPQHEAILWQIRLPRVLMAAAAGSSLALAGTAYQGLFRNPLADPYVMGVSAGAALGGASAIALLGMPAIAPLVARWGSLVNVGPVPLLAFLGGLGTVAIVYRLARIGPTISLVGLLLGGGAVGSLAVACVSLLLYFTASDVRQAILFWMMGGLGGASWSKLLWLIPYVGTGLFLLLYWARDLNLMLLGEETAHHLGVEVERLKRWVLRGGALLTAAAVAFCGAIGFIGLVVPHAARFLVGPDHRRLIPVAGLGGAITLVLADLVARLLLSPQELPVGLVMSLLGGPFFIWLLRSKLRPEG